jgi:hypothetical protein
LFWQRPTGYKAPGSSLATLFFNPKVQFSGNSGTWLTLLYHVKYIHSRKFNGVNMNLARLNETIDSTEIVEELIILSRKVFDKSSDDAKNIIETFITKSYLMGKKNMVKKVDD